MGVCKILKRLFLPPQEPISYKVDKAILEYAGQKYLPPISTDIVSEFGFPETLKGTDNNYWIAYFPLSGFGMIVDKKTDIIKNIVFGKPSTIFTIS